MSRFRYAFSLSKEELKEATPLGTIAAVDLAEGEIDSGLIISPEPSLDPADPLNWPMWRKLAILNCMSLYAFVTNFTSGSISSALPLLATPLAFNPPVSMTKLSRLIAVNVLMTGAANLWWVPMGNAFGRRPIILLGLLMLTLCSVWAGKATSYESLLAARLFMGIGGAPADTLAPKVVGEIFFVHQSGRAMGYYTVWLTLGPMVGGITGGYIAGRLGLQWLQWINVILAAVNFALCLVFCPETQYERQYDSVGRNGEKNVEDNGAAEQIEKAAAGDQASIEYAPYTFRRSLGFQKPQWSLMTKIFVPFQTLRLPGVWLVMLWYAGLVGGVVTVSTMGPQYVAAPPYLWGENAGLINVGGIVGAILGALMTALLADHVVKAKGVSRGLFIEPEARLPVAFPGLIMGTIGLWVFGFCAKSPSKDGWVGLQFGTGMLSFAMMQVPSIGFNYLIEAYGPVVADAFTMVTLLRAVISFSWTFFVSEWAQSAGPAVPFGVFGGLMGLFSILVIPVWLWGKRFRIATEKWVIS